jgi:hypothetical protein
MQMFDVFKGHPEMMKTRARQGMGSRGKLGMLERFYGHSSRSSVDPENAGRTEP